MIARVFPRKTTLSPDDPLAFYGPPGFVPGLFSGELQIHEVRVSVAFTYDLTRAEWLADQWARVAPVTIGGPGTGMRGEAFEPGLYLRPGATITSRGCPNKCWFCSVWGRDGTTRELPIRDGWNVLDDNLLACSVDHIRAVCAMLKRQPRRPRFTGGLEAARLTPELVAILADTDPEDAFFAYDTPDDYEPLVRAGRLIREGGFMQGSAHRRSHIRAYVLVGYPRDTIPAAEARLRATYAAGFVPMAMLFKSPGTSTDRGADWRRMAREWGRPSLMARFLKKEGT